MELLREICQFGGLEKALTTFEKSKFKEKRLMFADLLFSDSHLTWNRNIIVKDSLFLVGVFEENPD